MRVLLLTIANTSSGLVSGKNVDIAIVVAPMIASTKPRGFPAPTRRRFLAIPSRLPSASQQGWLIDRSCGPKRQQMDWCWRRSDQKHHPLAAAADLHLADRHVEPRSD